MLASVCAELANRAVRDVFIVCCDGLTGFPEAIEVTWHHATTVQTCVVHLLLCASCLPLVRRRRTPSGFLRRGTGMPRRIAT